MADQEVAKHTKKILHVATNTEHGAWHRLREILLEIVIIVFAVSISIWFHSMGEHRHEQKQVKAFLLGLKNDIASDISATADIKASYRNLDRNFTFLAKLDKANPPPAAVFDPAYERAGSNVSFYPQVSRYEGFKSSGRLTNIENEALLANILELYQDRLGQIGRSQGGWENRHNKLRDYLDMDIDPSDGSDRRFQLIVAPVGKQLLNRSLASPQLYERLDRYAALGAEIIKLIDAEYPDQAAPPQ